MSKRKLQEMQGENEDRYVFQMKRLMNPDDANVFGNVHGGSILRLIDEAGGILATRYCNSQATAEMSGVSGVSGEQCIGTLVRVEQTDFLQPMYIGEVADVTARITYTSKRSIQVSVVVSAQNVLKGQQRTTNSAKLWYVPVCTRDPSLILDVVPMVHHDPRARDRGHADYERQKAERQAGRGAEVMKRKRTISLADSSENLEKYSVSYSKTQLTHLVGPNDLTVSGNLKGGVVLKMMDECAGITAARHCCTVVVTASFDAINLRKRVTKGGLITVTGQAVYASNKTIEVQILVDAEMPFQPRGQKHRVVDGYVTFVSLDHQGKTLQIPPIKCQTQQEKDQFELGKLRYEAKKRLRMTNQIN